MRTVGNILIVAGITLMVASVSLALSGASVNWPWK